MAQFLKTSIVSLLLAVSSVAQFVPAPKNLKTTTGYYNQTVRYKAVPNGTCELTPGVKSYSGYVDIAPHQHIFWWFFEARNEDPHKAPLTVWINGGPGSSSMIGLFQELGPCGVDSNGDLYYNPYAWNNVSNMLFIDHPAQTGLSYSDPIPGYFDPTGNGFIIELPNNTCPDYAAGSCGTYSNPDPTDTANSTEAAAPSMWKTLQGFMGAFPQYSRNDFNFATESYGGHYGPIFNEYLETQNGLIRDGKLPGAHYIKLRTLIIGNGWYDPLIQYGAYYNFTVSPGNTYDYAPFNASIEAAMYNAMYGPGNCRDRTLECYATGVDETCSAADAFCAQEVEELLDNIADRDEYDIRETYSDPFPYSFYTDYLNLPRVQRALGAYVNFSDAGGDTTYYAFTTTGDDDREDGTIEALQALLAQGVYVVTYAGDADYNCNWLGGEVVAHEVGAKGFDAAGYANISTPDEIVHGQVKQSGRFAFARIYESGHEVPFYQPVAALSLFERAIGGLDIETGTVNVLGGNASGYSTTGPAKSTYREGNATIVLEDLPLTATYNTTTNEPNPVSNSSSSSARFRMGKRSEVDVEKLERMEQKRQARGPRYWNAWKFERVLSP